MSERVERLKISATLAGLRVKWIAVTLIQFFGFALILLGALPIFVPFIEASFVVDLPSEILGYSAVVFSLESVSSIAVGAIIVWWST